MKVLVIGAHGKIGKLTIQKLRNTEGFSPVAFLRKQEQVKEFDAMGVTSIVGNLEEDVEKLAISFEDVDAIVFTAGSGGNTGFDKTLAIDLDGAVKAIEAAEKVGIKRFVMISASHSDDRAFWEKSGMKPYYIAKHYADRFLKESDLNYTILRPVRLTDDKGTGKLIASGNPEEVGPEIPREDVAAVVVSVLNNRNTYGQTIELSSGNTPIESIYQEAEESIG